MIETLGTYKFEYPNGFVQTKELISVENFNRYKDLNNQKADILSEIQEKLKGKKNKNKEKDPILVEKLKVVVDKLKEFPDYFFVVHSPMYEAIETGVIHIDEPSGNAGDYPVKISKI